MSNKKIKGEYQKKRAERRDKRAEKKGAVGTEKRDKFDKKTEEIKTRGEDNIAKAKAGNDKTCVGKPSGYIFTTVAADGSMSTTTCP